MSKFYLAFWALAFIQLAFTNSAVAETIDVRYKTFYSHTRKLDSEDLNALQFAFGFRFVGSDRLCKLNSVVINTPKQNIPVKVTAEQRFSLPSDKVLSLADAKVLINTEEPANKCDMSVQLETKPEWLKNEYSVQDLQVIYAQYQAFFNEMGSFLSFMMPQVQGLRMQFADQSYSAQVSKDLAIVQGQLALKNAWLEEKKALSLPIKPLRVTAIAGK